MARMSGRGLPTRIGAVAPVIGGEVGISVLPVRAENWPDWRGPNHDGVSHETDLPTRWSATENVAWKLKMPGKAGSTPVIWGNTIFLTSIEGVEPKTEPKKKGMKKEAGN